VTNLLITGPPRSGKTTLIKKILKENHLVHRTRGFITEEFREAGKRVGFRIITIPEGKTAVLAKKGLISQYLVGRYGVDMESLEAVACRSLSEALCQGKIVVVDEIGKMELFSKNFQAEVMRAIESPQKVLATVMHRPHDFADCIKKRDDVRVLSLRRENFPQVFSEVKKWTKIIGGKI
jgi:nucleoside-triphosphatase